ncbi:MAG: secretin N-terminal domain-containing protein [Phycisphaerales bacterium]
MTLTPAHKLILAAGVVTAGVAAGFAMNRVAMDPARQTPATQPPATAPPAAEAPKADAASKPAESTEPPADGKPEATEERPAPKPVVRSEPEERDELNRRVIKNAEPTVLSFKSASVSELVPMIVEYTGKVVLPQDEVLARRITIVNDRPLTRRQALDLVFLGLQQKGIAVIEGREIIYLRDQAQVEQQAVPVLSADESTLERKDVGTIVQKVFGFRYAIAGNVAEVVKAKTSDAVKMTVEGDSNQLVISGPIALLQSIEKLIISLDRVSATSLVTETFHLKYGDASQIATNIRELFGDGARAGAGGGGGGGNQGGGNQGGAVNFRNIFGGAANQGGGNQQGGGGGGGGGGQRQTQATPAFRVSFNTQQNSVTVLAEPSILSKVRTQVEEEWDLPVPEDAATPQVFTLKYADPIRVRDLLEQSFSANAQRQSQTAGVSPLTGQFTFQALPEAHQILVVAKSPDKMEVVQKLIESLDVPRLAGLPRVISLKHSQAEELADQLNALLAQEGTLASIRRTVSELSEKGPVQSPFSQVTSDESGFNQQTGTQPDSMQFWWQRARTPTDNAGASTLVAKVRIVPVSRQNAVMVMAPPEYTDAVEELITKLDRPGRQVLITAVIAEISAEDALALGLRTSQNGITPTFGENNFSIGANQTAGVGNNTSQAITGTKNNLLPGLFDTSVLNTGVNINLLLQALAQKTSISILSEPRVYTGDNQEAEFFSGQDIPFITESQPNNNGNLLQSFDYRAVGISLRVRPRITPQRDVDIKINLELSSIVPGQTLFGGAVVDRRETTTQLIVQDGQTVILSGIMRTEDSKITRKVPFFGDLPLVGPLFTSVENTRSNTELVAFVTPIVIENPSENEAANGPFRQRLGELREQLRGTDSAPWPPVPTDAPASGKDK